MSHEVLTYPGRGPAQMGPVNNLAAVVIAIAASLGPWLSNNRLPAGTPVSNSNSSKVSLMMIAICRLMKCSSCPKKEKISILHVSAEYADDDMVGLSPACPTP